jgi:5-methyltetrahydrofolate--homocysteine methyltransferase
MFEMDPDGLNLDHVNTLIINGDIEGTRKLTARFLDAGEDAHHIISNHLAPAMEEVGRRFEEGDYYISELLISARAAATVLELAEPYLAGGSHEPAGMVVMGTVQGDLHDIGKNIVTMMLRGNGFEVMDLGTNVSPSKFVEAIEDQKPDVLGMSALLTTTMNAMGDVIEALNQAGLRDKVRVMIGGAPISEEYCSQIGADGFATNAASAVRLAKRLIER